MTNELVDRLRAQAASLRRKPTPLADLIPLLTQAADALASQVVQEPCCIERVSSRACERGTHGCIVKHAAPVAAGEPHTFHAFLAWASREGYDTAHTYDTEHSKWVALNPMTADLWKCWQAASGVALPAPAQPPREFWDLLTEWSDSRDEERRDWIEHRFVELFALAAAPQEPRP